MKPAAKPSIKTSGERRADEKASAFSHVRETDARARAAVRLIVNADDFGISKEVNEAVIRAFREGVLTSASLMVTGAALTMLSFWRKKIPGLPSGFIL